VSEPVKCEYQVFAGSYFDPPEWCPNDAVEGEEFCPDHMPFEPDPDAWRYEMLYEGDSE
jgi:hypothetical protein